MAFTATDYSGLVREAPEIVAVAAPASGRIIIAYGYIYNGSASTVTIKMRVYTNATAYAERPIQIAAGKTWEFSGRLSIGSSGKITLVMTDPATLSAPPEYLFTGAVHA